jgi:hypothetical protein
MNFHFKITSMTIIQIKKEAKNQFPIYPKKYFKAEFRTYEEYKATQLLDRENFIAGAMYVLKNIKPNNNVKN